LFSAGAAFCSITAPSITDGPGFAARPVMVL